MHEPALPQRGRYRLHLPADDMTRRRAGDSNPRGALERHQGLFRLRDGLTAAGELPMATTLDEVLADWHRQIAEGRVTAEVIRVYTSQLRGLVRLMGTRRLYRVCEVTPNLLLIWVQMPSVRSGGSVTLNTAKCRRSAARSFFETAKCLGITDANPAKLVELPSRSGRYIRALTDDQIAHMQRHARLTLTDLRTPAALAVVMSGASARELGSVTVDDVDLANRRVWVHDGGYRQRDRWIPLYDDWCIAAVTAQVQALRAEHGEQAAGIWLVYRAHPTTPSAKRQATAANGIISRLMQTTRVHRPGLTRVESIREWLAVQVYAETGSVEAVALRLGMSSLDAAAHLVGHDWVADADATHEPPAHRQGTVS